MIFGWKMCSKLNSIAIFLILANFAAFLDHTKENADVSENDSQSLIVVGLFDSSLISLTKEI